MTHSAKRGRTGQSLETKAKSKKKRRSSGLPRSVRFKLFIRRNRVVLQAGVIFALCVLVSIFAYSKLLGSAAFTNLKAFTANATGLLLNLFGASTEVNGTIISSNAFSVEIVGECTSIVPMIIFLSAVLAYPCRIKQKLVGIAIGIVGLYVLNLVRTVSLFYIGSSFPDLFNTAHFLVWQASIIFLAIILWLFWIGKLARDTS